ncbi:hypothetical protein [Streptomyces iconiensis]|uniref:Uncharacterized protein n=1 Tax=Streptomyces iconiensis TaxID=1384038 RepID=A0ABT7A7Q5_9ACTN|nr:hypothetical protein [Streptomyces iconiensis]MDJ1137350.1 hypothetical protein [Streptomyces iconiensis]
MESETPSGVMEVTVQLSECGEEDAHAVFGMLGALYRSDWDPAAAGGAGTGTGPDVWMAQFDVTPGDERASAVALGTPVAAELQGSPQAVDRLRSVLEDAFAVREEMTVAGDQERQTRLRLERR